MYIDPYDLVVALALLALLAGVGAGFGAKQRNKNDIGKILVVTSVLETQLLIPVAAYMVLSKRYHGIVATPVHEFVVAFVVLAIIFTSIKLAALLAFAIRNRVWRRSWREAQSKGR